MLEHHTDASSNLRKLAIRHPEISARSQTDLLTGQQDGADVRRIKPIDAPQ
jgi:hypothetical protein